KDASLASAIPGQTIDYTVTVTNNGPAPVPFADIAVSEPHATVAHVGQAPTTLAAGEHVTYTASHKVTEAECGTNVENTATVSLAYGSILKDTTPANDSSSVYTKVDCDADLAIIKSASLDSAIPGQTIDYTVTVTNNGPAAVAFADIAVS